MRSKSRFGKKSGIVIVAVTALMLLTALLLVANAEINDTSSVPNVALSINKDTGLKISKQVLESLYPGSNVESIELVQLPSGDPVWEVRSDQRGEAWISANDGKTKFVFNGRTISDAISYKKAALLTMDKTDALAQVKSKARSIGVSVPTTAPTEANLFSNRDDEEGFYQWSFRWPRESRGYYYHDDWVFIIVDAYKGDLIGYNYNHNSLGPTSYDVEISKQKAVDLTLGSRAKNISKIKAETARLMIVNPNYRWSEKPSLFSREARLAWVLDFDKINGKGEVWIDAATGENLGGEESR